MVSFEHRDAPPCSSAALSAQLPPSSLAPLLQASSPAATSPLSPMPPGGAVPVQGYSPLMALLQADLALRRQATARPTPQPGFGAVDVAAMAAMGTPGGGGGAATSRAVGTPQGKKAATDANDTNLGLLTTELPGVLPGVTEARVGMLAGLRTPAMLKYYGELAKKKRRPPTDLSGLTDEEKVERRKQQSREYSRLARKRIKDSRAELMEELEGVAFLRDVVECAPGIVFLTLSADLNCTVLYASQAVEEVLHLAVEKVEGSSLWDLLREDDRAKLVQAVSQLILTKGGPVRVSCGIRTSFTDYFVPSFLSLRYGTLGIACSIWVATSTAKGT